MGTLASFPGPACSALAVRNSLRGNQIGPARISYWKRQTHGAWERGYGHTTFTTDTAPLCKGLLVYIDDESVILIGYIVEINFVIFHIYYEAAKL